MVEDKKLLLQESAYEGPYSEEPTALQSLKKQLKSATNSKRDFSDFLFKILLGVITIIIITPFFLIFFQVADVARFVFFGNGEGEGIDFLFTLPTEAEEPLNGGIANSIVGSILLCAIAGSLGIPLSVFGAVYISEYTRAGKLRSAIEFGADVLAGIPSIVFGAFGLALFVDGLHLGMGLFSGGMTLAFMMIPTILRTTQEALRQVPISLREASLALGATKWTTTWRITIRAAFPGIITGVLLAIGRIIGETAPLLFTSGNSLGFPGAIIGSASWVASLPYTIYLYVSDPRDYLNQKASAAALTLLLIVLVIDLIANYISRKVTRRVV
ncbi:MAG: phosphate ABC transporter permease PstA [Candidatus Thorarchaeota archaeon]|nr:phosphate ABC transporter permease PstA [Candidatus Thorarchaeota archaeon]